MICFSNGIQFRGLFYGCDLGFQEHWFDSARVEGRDAISVSYDPRDGSSIYFKPSASSEPVECYLLGSNKITGKFSTEELEQMQQAEHQEREVYRSTEDFQNILTKDKIQEIVDKAEAAFPDHPGSAHKRVSDFYPAANELGNPKPCDNLEHLKMVDQNWEDFLQMALDISFLFRFSYYGFHLGMRIRKALQFDLLPVHHNWVRTILNDPVVMECGNLACMDSLAAMVHDPYHLISQIQCVHVCLHLRLCRAMFGDLEEFCNARM